MNALGLIPLQRKELGIWDLRSITGVRRTSRSRSGRSRSSAGGRPDFEMEQVLPGSDPDDPFSDPITDSTDLQDTGDRPGAKKILMELCEADLRCLDAHAHLGTSSLT